MNTVPQGDRGVSRETPSATLGLLRRVSRETLLLPVHAWRLVSRLLPPRCRYYPSCSQYALTAVRRHGVVLGTLLAAYRVIRCNPWSLGGVDHVPPRRGSGRTHAIDASPDPS